MVNIAWTNALSVGVPLIDEQHKALIEHLSHLSSAVAKRQGETEIMGTLTFLVDYTQFHFSTEEKHMALTGYPGLAIQQAEHSKFKGLLTTFHADLAEEGVTKALADSINTLLLNWLTNHIRLLDREFGTFLRGKGIVITE